MFTDGEKIAGEINNGYEFSNSLHLPSLPNRKGSNVSFNDSLDVLHEFHRKRPVAMGYVETETWREKYTSCRWTVTYLVFTFFTIQVIYIQCMSMALVCMVKNLTTSANSSTSDFAVTYYYFISQLTPIHCDKVFSKVLGIIKGFGNKSMEDI